MAPPPKLPWRKFAALKGAWIPIITPPMHGVSGAELASAVARGGGMSFLGSGFAKDKESLHREYNRALIMGGSFGHDRIGIGLVGFTGDWLVEMAIALSPPAIWIMFGDYTEPIKKIKDADIPIIVVVESVEEAVKAAELGASAVVAQEPPTSEEGDGDYSLEEDMPEEDEGSDEEENDDNRDQGNESRGHGPSSTSTLRLVPKVVNALKAKGFDKVAVLAAGGIEDGRQVAAAFARGAAGAVMGTCLAATKEGMYLEEEKQCYLAAKAAVTHQNRKCGHDDLGAVPCPAGIDGRVTGNTFSNSHGTVAPAEEAQQKALKEKLAKGQEESDLDVAPGEGVGQIHNINSAEEVVKSVWDAACVRMLEISRHHDSCGVNLLQYVPFRIMYPNSLLVCGPSSGHRHVLSHHRIPRQCARRDVLRRRV